MNNIQTKIVYKKIENYDNMTSNLDDSQINLDDTIISINKQDPNLTSNSTSEQIYSNNINLIKNINKELFNELNNAMNNNDTLNDTISNTINDTNSNNAINDANIENFISDLEIKNNNSSQNTFFDKLITNDINSWIFLGIIMISFTIIIMIMFNKK